MQLIRIGSKIPRKIGSSTTEKLSEPLQNGMPENKNKKKVNHFALKSKLYLKAVRSAFDELQQLQAA